MISKNIQDDLIELAKSAGYRIMEIYEKDFSVFEKEDQSPLTEADLTSHQTIVNRLAEITPDIPEFFSNSNKANLLLNWSAEKGIGDMCRDARKFQMKLKETNT